MVLNESDNLIPDAVIEEWVRQAGEPIVAPPGSHVTRLRQQILVATSERSPKHRGRVWWTGMAAAVAVALIASSLQLLRADRLAWADIVEASRRQPWMHVLGTDVDGSRTEVWFSGLHRIQALKADGMALFDDYSANVRFVYVERENRILRSQLSPADARAFEATANGFSQLFLGGTTAAETVVGLNDFARQESRDIVIEGRTWIELTITHKNGDIGVYRVDPKTRLPIEWSGRVNGKPRGPSRFDFPTEGPKDIYMLGVPKVARIEDRPKESPRKAETAAAGTDAATEDAARQAMIRKASIQNLKLIGLAMHNYHDKEKTFPPAFTSKDGKPLLSWRVALLPYMENPAAQALYQDFHLDEPWDSPHNKMLVGKMPQIYQSPASKLNDGRTVYLTPRGETTAFPGEEAINIRKISDGTSLTIAVVEVDDKQAVAWTRPDDWQFVLDHPKVGLGGQLNGGFLTAFCDGSVRFISNNVDDQLLKALFTMAGGEVVELPN